MSLNKKMFVFFFWDWLGLKCREKTGQGLLAFNFKYILKAEQLKLIPFFSLLCQVWVEKTSWRPCLGGCGIEAGTHLFSLIYLFLPARPWGKQQSRGMQANQEHSSLPVPFFSSTDKISTEDMQLSQQCRCHQVSALFQSMNQSRVRASYPASPDKSAVTSEVKSHYPASCKHP